MLGATASLAKPFELAELLAVIREVLAETKD
jgi:DNA-binding response OmpR family regulator